MNAKIIIAIIAVVAVAGGGYGYYQHESDKVVFHDVIEPYANYYLDITDADSLTLKDKPVAGILGRNIEDCYGGNTLYKTVDGHIIEVEMFKLDEYGKKTAVDIDRPIRMLQELDDNAFLIVYYGVESDSSSSDLYMQGYRYDPNCQLTFIVDADTGAMFDLTRYTREIVFHGDRRVTDTFHEFEFLSLVDDGYMFRANLLRDGADLTEDGAWTHIKDYYDEYFLTISIASGELQTTIGQPYEYYGFQNWRETMETSVVFNFNENKLSADYSGTWGGMDVTTEDEYVDELGTYANVLKKRVLGNFHAIANYPRTFGPAGMKCEISNVSFTCDDLDDEYFTVTLNEPDVITVSIDEDQIVDFGVLGTFITCHISFTATLVKA